MCLLNFRDLIVLPVLLLGLLPSSASNGAEVITPTLTPELELGKAIYETYCIDCHGMNASGSVRGPTFLHKIYHPGRHGDEAFLLAPLIGVKAHHWQFGDMPPIGGITELELLLIRDYIRALQIANEIY